MHQSETTFELLEKKNMYSFFIPLQYCAGEQILTNLNDTPYVHIFTPTGLQVTQNIEYMVNYC